MMMVFILLAQIFACCTSCIACYVAIRAQRQVSSLLGLIQDVSGEITELERKIEQRPAIGDEETFAS